MVSKKVLSSCRSSLQEFQVSYPSRVYSIYPVKAPLYQTVRLLHLQSATALLISMTFWMIAYKNELIEQAGTSAGSTKPESHYSHWAAEQLSFRQGSPPMPCGCEWCHQVVIESSKDSHLFVFVILPLNSSLVFVLLLNNSEISGSQWSLFLDRKCMEEDRQTIFHVSQ